MRPTAGRSGEPHHNRRRTEPLTVEQQQQQQQRQQRQDGSFDDGGGGGGRGRSGQRHMLRRISRSESSYFGSPTASSAVASAVAFSDARFNASLALAAESPTAFSGKKSHSVKGLKRFLLNVHSRGRSSEQSVAGERGTAGQESAGGATVDEGGGSRCDRAGEGETPRAASSPKAVTCGGGRNSNTSTQPRRSRSSARSPWRPMFMCFAGCGKAGYDAGGGGHAVESRTRSVSVGSLRGSSSSSKSRGSKSACWGPSLGVPPFQPKVACERAAVRTSAGSTRGGGVRVGGGDEQHRSEPRTKTPLSHFPHHPPSFATETSTASPTTPASVAAAAAPPPKPIRGLHAVLTSAGSVSGGGVSGDGDDEQPPIGPQANKRSSGFRRASSVSESSDSSAITLASMGATFLSNGGRPAAPTPAGSTNGGGVSFRGDREQPLFEPPTSRFPPGFLPRRQPSSVSECSDCSVSTLASAKLTFLMSPAGGRPPALTAAGSTSGGGVSVDGDHEQQHPVGPLSKKRPSGFPPRRRLSSASERSNCSSSTLAASGGTFLSNPRRGRPAALTPAGPTGGGGDRGVRVDNHQEQPPTGPRSKKSSSRLPPCPALSVAERSDASAATPAAAGAATTPRSS